MNAHRTPTPGRTTVRLLAAAPLFALLAAALGLLLVAGAIVGPPAQSSPQTTPPSPLALADIPAAYLRFYRDAGAHYDLDWAYLAAIGKIESDHGRSRAPGVRSGQNAHGCCAGPMQFWTAPPHPNTWDRYGRDANSDGRADPYDPADAIPAAARYLTASGAPADWRAAIFAYNHSNAYVQRVVEFAARYRDAATNAPDMAGGVLAWPLAGAVTSGFGPRAGRMHEGIDITARAGTPVRAAADGTVSFGRQLAGYGLFLCLTHSPRLTTCYAHLSRLGARAGDRVRRGEQVALSGCTGRCFGPHLHFEVHAAGSWSHASAVDPMPWLTSPPRS